MADPATQLNFLTGILQRGTAQSEDAKLNRLGLEMRYGSPQAQMERAKAEDFLTQREAELDRPVGIADIGGAGLTEFGAVRLAKILDRLGKPEGANTPYDPKTNTFTRNGKIVRMRELNRNMKKVQGIVTARTNPAEYIADLREFYEDAGRIGTDPARVDRAGRALEFIAKKEKEYADNPVAYLYDWKKGILQAQANNPNMPGFLDSDLASIDSQIKKAEAKMPKEGDIISEVEDTIKGVPMNVTTMWIADPDNPGKLKRKIFKARKFKKDAVKEDKGDKDKPPTPKEMREFSIWFDKGIEGQDLTISQRNGADYYAGGLGLEIKWETIGQGGKLGRGERDNLYKAISWTKKGSIEDYLSSDREVETQAVPPTPVDDPFGILGP